jgi:hypothetical protein
MSEKLTIVLNTGATYTVHSIDNAKAFINDNGLTNVKLFDQNGEVNIDSILNPMVPTTPSSSSTIHDNVSSTGDMVPTPAKKVKLKVVE